MPSEILMIAPDHFGFNPETAADNHFQKDHSFEPQKLRSDARNEFDQAVRSLRDLGVKVHVIHSPSTSPDAVFPNNWISFHHEGYVLYSMLSELRRTEIVPQALRSILRDQGAFLDLRPYASSDRFLEGTGSLVLDRENRIAYACLSGRTDNELLDLWALKLGYRTVKFHGFDSHDRAVYHTNVLMAIGPTTALLCMEAIRDPEERSQVRESLEAQHRIVDISMEQMAHFAGNAIYLGGEKGGYWIMSETALTSLTEYQVRSLQVDGEIVSINVPTIEQLGGGSIRCMICEISHQ